MSLPMDNMFFFPNMWLMVMLVSKLFWLLAIHIEQLLRPHYGSSIRSTIRDGPATSSLCPQSTRQVQTYEANSQLVVGSDYEGSMDHLQLFAKSVICHPMSPQSSESENSKVSIPWMVGICSDYFQETPMTDGYKGFQGRFFAARGACHSGSAPCRDSDSNGPRASWRSPTPRISEKFNIVQHRSIWGWLFEFQDMQNSRSTWSWLCSNPHSIRHIQIWPRNTGAGLRT